MNYFEFHMPNGNDELINLDAVRSITISPMPHNFNDVTFVYYNKDLVTITEVTSYGVRLLKECVCVKHE